MVFADIGQVMQRRCDIILRALVKMGTWVTAGSLPGWRTGGEGRVLVLENEVNSRQNKCKKSPFSQGHAFHTLVKLQNTKLLEEVPIFTSASKMTSQWRCVAWPIPAKNCIDLHSSLYVQPFVPTKKCHLTKKFYSETFKNKLYVPV